MTPTEKLAAFKAQLQSLKEGIEIEFVDIIGLGNQVLAPIDWNFQTKWKSVRVDDNGNVGVLFRRDYGYMDLGFISVDESIKILGDVVNVLERK